MQKYTPITENHNIDASRQLLLDNDMSALTLNSGLDFPSYADVGTPCYRIDQERLFVLRSNGSWRMIADASKTAISLEEAQQKFASISHTHTSDFAPRQSNARPGVTKLYRRDSDNGYNVQTNWTGTYWRLFGYNGDVEHAGVQVEHASTADNATNATKLNGLAASNYLRSNVSSTFNGALTITSNLVVQGNATVSGDVTSSSDARLKENVAPLENALETVNKLQGVSYHHKITNRPGIGFIAQDLMKVVPVLVSKGPDKKLSVAYGNVTALLVEAVKELTNRVQKLEAVNGI
ncbi:tail fiber domain-containing protein [Vreelandella sulfidaeris]